MKLPEDPIIRELIGEFVDDWINDLNEKYPIIIQQKNVDELYRLAHTLKGSCYQFGLDDIAEMGIELMDYSKSGDWEKIAEYEDILKNRFQETKIELEKINK